MMRGSVARRASRQTIQAFSTAPLSQAFSTVPLSQNDDSNSSSSQGSTYSVIRLTPFSKSASHPRRSRINVREILTSTKYKSSIHARDLLSLGLDGRGGSHGDGDWTTNSSVGGGRSRSLLLPRGESVVVSLGHVKAIVFRDEALLFDANRPSVRMFAEQVHEQCVEEWGEEKKGIWDKLSNKIWGEGEVPEEGSAADHFEKVSERAK